MTWKKATLRGCLGIPIGIAIGVVIVLCISAFAGNGSVMISPPEITAAVGTELGGAILQFSLCGLVGFCMAFCSSFFEFSNWSMLKQTVLHFAATSLSFFPIAWFCYWIPHTIIGFLSYLAIWIIFYVIIWISLCICWRKRIQEVNEKLEN